MLLYAFTILISAFLLFQVQPIIANMILPWFGGSAAVWTTCLLFFQVVLLLGYLYAYCTVRYLRPAVQAVLHIVLLVASLFVLPVIPSPSWKPSGAEDPTLRILGLLTDTVGLPYFLLSTTGPLVQAWVAFGGSSGPRPVLPYRLYALSNAGSMFALLSYPFLFEPILTRQQQGVGWSVAYAVFAVLCALGALQLRRAARKVDADPGDPDVAVPPRPGWKLHLLWMALAACASTLLLAVSNHITQNVAAIPFLWVLPLSLYLLSFILCFERDGWYSRAVFLPLLIVALGAMSCVLATDLWNLTVKVLIPLFLAALFICCMVCHGELTRLKPHPRYLTAFYLMVSLGGALGGVFVSLVAPRVFPAYYELPIGIVLCAVLMLVLLRPVVRPGEELDRGRAWGVWAMWATLTLSLAVYLVMATSQSNSGQRVIVRNFYGGLRVGDWRSVNGGDMVRILMHGTINHGEQSLNPAHRRQLGTYFHPRSGVGLAILNTRSGGPQRVGIIGLGTGTLAAYGRPGDIYRYYEINPLVISLARSEFTYLRDSPARVEVALGDARLTLEAEPNQDYDVLIVDAFSSDAIPVHLLTKEAFAVYLRHLDPRGVLAVHISNRYLDLQPVVKRAAQEFGKEARTVTAGGVSAMGPLASTWVLVPQQKEFFERPALKAAAVPTAGPDDFRLWTDDYSNLLCTLK